MVIIQIVVRHSKRKSIQRETNSRTNDDFDKDSPNELPIKVGNLVTCYLDKYKDEEPQIGEIMSVPSNDTIQIGTVALIQIHGVLVRLKRAASMNYG